MIRRNWVIYQRKSRQVVSHVYHRRRIALDDLRSLNDYCEARKYAMQIIKIDHNKKIVSRYPAIELKNFPDGKPEKTNG